MSDALTFLGEFLLFVVVAQVLIPVALILLIDKVWGYEPDAYEAAYVGNLTDER